MVSNLGFGEIIAFNSPKTVKGWQVIAILCSDFVTFYKNTTIVELFFYKSYHFSKIIVARETYNNSF